MAVPKKPTLLVTNVDGDMRLVGVGKAAKWMGLSGTTLRNIANGRGEAMGYSAETMARVAREYPQLMGAKK